MKSQDSWKNVIDKDMPDFGPITNEVREITKKNSACFRGSIRLATGRFFTDDEYEKYRNRVLKTRLP